jgi:hypothetical protein
MSHRLSTTPPDWLNEIKLATADARDAYPNDSADMS